MNTKTKTAASAVSLATKKMKVPEPVIVIHKPNPQMRGPSKTFQQDGHWIEKPDKTAILVCECSNRYLKTRPNQVKCLRCMAFSTR